MADQQWRAVVHKRGIPRSVYWTSPYGEQSEAKKKAMERVRKIYGDFAMESGEITVIVLPSDRVNPANGEIRPEEEVAAKKIEVNGAILQKAIARPSRAELMIQIAGLVAQRSTCRRLHVGAIICDPDLMSVIAMGFNGAPRSFPNDCESNDPGDCGCVHAEVNALIKAPFFSGALTMFCTDTPCDECAKLIINSRVTNLYAFRAYRLTTGVRLLRRAGIQVSIWKDGRFLQWDNIHHHELPSE